MSFPPRFLDDLRARLDLSEVVGRKIKLTRAGRELKGCCPFHNEKTPSFYVNDDKQFFHCFGCGAHGDIVGFTMRHDNLSFVEAVETLAGQAGMQVPAMRPEDVQKAKDEKDFFAMMEATTKFFEAHLTEPANRGIFQYLEERNLKPETISSFRLGYSPADGGLLPAHLLKLGFSEEQLLEAGLARRSTRNEKELYSFFRDRVMFPIADRRGRVLAFSGRILPEKLRKISGGESPPKYINSGESRNFQKRHHVYAEALARNACGREGKWPIVVEGQMDVIALHQAGFTSAVAPLGTALTEEQIELCWKMCAGDERYIMLCFDGDNAGLKAARRAIDRALPLLKPRQSVRFVFLPTGEDPDTLVSQQGPQAFQEKLDQATTLPDFLWSEVSGGRDLSNPEDRAAIEAIWNEHMNLMVDKTLQVHFGKFLKDKLWARPKQTAEAVPFAPREATPVYAPRQSNYSGGGNYGQKPVMTGPRPTAPAKKGDIADEVLLVSIVYHPRMLVEAEEEFATLAYGRDDMAHLHALVQEWFSSVTEPADLEYEVLKPYLIKAGAQEALNWLERPALKLHTIFAKPGSDYEKVAIAWKNLYQQRHRQSLMEEVSRTATALARDNSPKTEERLLAMRKTLEDEMDRD